MSKILDALSNKTQDLRFKNFETFLLCPKVIRTVTGINDFYIALHPHLNCYQKVRKTCNFAQQYAYDKYFAMYKDIY